MDFILDVISGLIEHYRMYEENNIDMSNKALFLREFIDEYIDNVL